jgi:hypothetical protein
MDAMVISMRVTAPDRRIARVSIGSRQFSIGRPLEFDDASPHVAAMEYALGAVGGEVVNGIRAFAARRRLEIDAIEAVVTGELAGGLTYLEVIGEDGTPRIARIHVKVFVAAEKGAPVAALFEHVLQRLPLVGTLRDAVDLQVELVLNS